MPESTEAGPSSRPEVPDLATYSYRHLFEHLDATRQAQSSAEIHAILRSRSDQLSRCGEAFPKASAASKSKLAGQSITVSGQQLSIDDDIRDLVEHISSRHDLDEVVALTFLRSFLDSEDRSLDVLVASRAPSSSSKRKGRSSLADEAVAELLDAFTVFLFEEELHITRCVAALLRIADDAEHDYYRVAQDLLPSIATPTFGRECLSRIKVHTSTPLPSLIRDSPRYSPYWAKHGLRQQLALLEVVFLLYYSRLSPSADVVVAVLTLLQETSMGQQQANEAFFDSQSVELLGCVQQMLAFIAVESLELEAAMGGYQLPSPDDTSAAEQRSIWQSAEHLNQALEILESTSSADPAKAPILLAWALVLHKLDDALEDDVPPHLSDLAQVITPEDGGPPIWTRLASAAFTPAMGLFPAMKSMALSPFLAPDSSSAHFEVTVASSLAFRSVFKGLLLGITEVVRPEYVASFDDLVGLWEVTFDASRTGDTSEEAAIGVGALCQQFWSYDSQFETRRATLETAQRRWPVSFRPLIRLLKALNGVCGRSEASDTEDAALAVLRSFESITTIAQVLPPTSAALRPPWEVFESPDYSVLDYKATRPIPVFGSRLVIPPGTVGRMVSEVDQTPIVVVWNLDEEQSISGWRVARDVLADFVHLLPDPTALVPKDEQDNVFANGNGKGPGFDSFAPSAGDPAVVATELLDLFSSVLVGAPSKAGALLSHLEEEPNAPTLVSILRRVLEQGLGAYEIPIKLVTAAFRLLGLLLQHRPSEIWMVMRSSNLVVGSSGPAIWASHSGLLGQSASSSSSSSSALLSSEMATGNFLGTQSLLSFQCSLLAELQRSQCAVSPDLLRIKVDVLLRAMGWMVENVWPEHGSWRFNEAGDKIRIGALCTQLLQGVFNDRAVDAQSPLGELGKAVESLLVSHASLVHLNSLVSTIGAGQQMLLRLHRAGKHAEAETAHGYVEASLQLATSVVYRRQELAAKGQLPKGRLGPVERLFLGGATSSSNLAASTGGKTRSSAAVAIVGYLRTNISVSLSREAARFLTALAISSGKTLALSDELQLAVPALLDILDNTQQDVSLRVACWTLAALLVETRSTVARLLLAGDEGGQEGQASQRTILRVAVDSLTIWQTLWDHDPQLLSAVLHFLCCAWSARVLALDEVRSDGRFWSSVTALIGASMDEDEHESAIDSDAEQDHEKISARSHRLISKTRALLLLSTDLEASPRLQRQGSKTASIESAFHLVTSSPSFTELLQSALAVPCNPELHGDVMARMAATFPEIRLEALRHAKRRDEWDGEREYGRDYIYNLAALKTRLLGLCGGSTDADDADDSATVIDEAVISRVLTMVASVNLDWSLIDSRTSLLRGWRTFLDNFARRTRAEYRGQGQESKHQQVRDACLRAWPVAVKIVGEERREGAVMVGLHAERAALLEVLLQAAWGGQDSSKPSVETVRQVVEEVKRLITHDVFSVHASVQGQLSPPFHRAVFSITLLAARRCRQVVTPSSGDAATHKTIHHAIDVFTSHAIVALRHVVDAAAVRLSSSGATDKQDLTSIEEELALISSLVELLVRQDVTLEPHFWLAQFQEVRLLPALVSLFRRAPVASGPSHAQPGVPAFLPSLLSLFLSLAARPQATEQLVLSGLMSALTSNALTPILESGGLAPTAGNAAHASWLNMLRLVIAAVDNLDGTAVDDEGMATGRSWAPSASRRFVVTEVVGFVRLYGAQLARSLEFAPVGKFSTSSASSLRRSTFKPFSLEGQTQGQHQQAQIVTHAQLEEAEVVSRLFLVMAAADANGEDQSRRTQDDVGSAGLAEILSTFASRVTQGPMLQQVVYLAQRPRQLAALLRGSGGGEDGRVPATGGEEAWERHALSQLVRIAMSTISALWHYTRGSVVLSQSAAGGATSRQQQQPVLIVRPTMRTSPSDPASIGTLLDAGAFCVEALRNGNDGSSSSLDPSMLAATLEECLCLCVTQLLLASSGHQDTDVEAGIQRDVEAAVEGAIDVIGKGVDGEDSQVLLRGLLSLLGGRREGGEERGKDE
ncbi:hypothetical protein BDZ90DRAFT_254662 [Jaminaea rosea]|uniref:Nucleoporin Nup188 N-terminal subdomain III domain-containing protein n=1 Tax=Jaminaea rosea TaxID=1569628 RepID=A0A316UMG6_9BASI|nr:hypothetical protein BDZ90DRAFT_254662 [Jaminaea rosea]PWN26008.1 hypothetical protein BDZ90DRAFT_254662 [Jaminaea rosea]